MANKFLLFTHDEHASQLEIERLGGRVLQEFTDRVFVAELPEELDPSALTASTQSRPPSLDDISLLAANAWTEKRDKKIRLRSVPADGTDSEGLPWDTSGYEPPRQRIGMALLPNLQAPGQIRSRRLSSGTPTSLYMVGSVAVGVILVSSTHNAFVMDAAQQRKMITEVQDALDWLASMEPRARVSFVYDIHAITVAAKEGPYPGGADAYESMESGWRDEALAQMGYGKGRKGYRRYVTDLQDYKNTDWAYAAFFTNYPLHHFAYAVSEKIVMHCGNDGWGPNHINKVFAHETCHIFGAEDEYGGCRCGGAHGHLKAPNNNCRNCTGAQISCLMNANTLQMCEFSRRQIGWDAALFP